MPFDVDSAVEVTASTKPAIPTTRFDISTAQESNATPVKKVSAISSFLRSIFRSSPIEQAQTDLFTLDQYAGVKEGDDKETIGKKYAEYFRNPPKPNAEGNAKIEGALQNRETGIINQGVLRQVEAPMTLAIGAGAAAAPAATAVGVGTFTLLDSLFNGRRWVEENAPNTDPVIKDLVEIGDFIIKAGAIGGGIEHVKGKTVKRMADLNQPKAVEIPPDQVGAIKESPEISESLGIKDEHLAASEGAELPIQVPVDKVMDLVGTPKWEQLKEILSMNNENILPHEIKVPSPEEILADRKTPLTEQAINFAKENKDNKDSAIKALDVQRQEIKDKVDEIYKIPSERRTDAQDNEAFQLGRVQQFYREATEALKGKLKGGDLNGKSKGQDGQEEMLKEPGATAPDLNQYQEGTTKSSKTKAQIRKSTGLVKDEGQTMSEREAYIGSLRERVKAAKEATAFTKEQIFDTQKALTDLIDKSELEPTDKSKFLKTIKNIQTPEDFRKAMEPTINKKGETTSPGLEARINTFLDKMERKGMSSDIKNVKTEGIATEYKQAIEKIQNSLDLNSRSDKTMAKREKMRAFVKRMKAEGKDISIPKEKLDLLDKPTLNDLTVEQLRDVKSTVEHLARLGKTKQTAREANYLVEKDNNKEKLLKDTQAVNYKKVPKVPIGGTTNQWAERYVGLLNYFTRTKMGLTPMEGVADVTGMQKVKKALDKSFGNYLSFNDKNFKEWHEITKEFGEGEFRRIGIHSAALQEGGVERLINSGLTKEEINSVKLSPVEVKAYNFARATFDKYFSEVEQFSKEVYNEPVGKVDNYVSFLSDYEAMSDLEMYDRFGQRPQEAINRRTKNVEKGFTKERASVSNIKLETNIDKIFRRHLDDVGYMLTMGRDIKMYSEIVNSAEMRESLGDVGAMAWLQYLDLMARKGGADSAKKIALLDMARRNMGAGVLGFRLSSALVQFSSFGDTMATMGSEWAMRGATNIATSKEWRAFIMDNFPEVRKAVGDDIAFREFGEDMLGKAARVGMLPLQFMDGIMRSTAASAAYEKIARERGVLADLANPDKEIVAEATKLMRQSQGSSFFKDQPLATTTGYGLMDNQSLNKTILQFQSFMLGRWDNINRQIWRLGIKEGNYKKAISSLMWLTIFGFTGEEIMRRTSKALMGNTKKQNPLAQDVAFDALQAVPIVGQVASSIAYSSNPVPIVKTMQDAIEGTSAIFNAKSPESKAKGFVKATGAAGSAAGIPGSTAASQFVIDHMKKGGTKIRD